MLDATMKDVLGGYDNYLNYEKGGMDLALRQTGVDQPINQLLKLGIDPRDNMELKYISTVDSSSVHGVDKSIAVAQNTNLSVVAPGIAEALFATALGLFVAIPAGVAYNKIPSDLSKYFISLETFMDEFTTIFFRQLEKN